MLVRLPPTHHFFLQGQLQKMRFRSSPFLPDHHWLLHGQNSACRSPVKHLLHKHIIIREQVNIIVQSDKRGRLNRIKIGKG